MKRWMGLGIAAFGLVVMLQADAAMAVCGDAILDGSEECDPGGSLHIDGDSTKPTCTTGSNCFYVYSCCKFNCQYVGQGAPCSDGDACSSPDICNNVGQCIGTANSVNGTACDDGLFCNGTETCTNGACGSPSGNPCPGSACNTCQEGTDSCYDPAGTACTSDSNACTVDSCDGSGTCAHTAGNAGVACRASAGACDVVETCTGSSTTCPADVVAPSTTMCRSSAGVCDAAEYCTGSSGVCPADSFQPASTVCRSASGICDAAETCTGSSAACPADSLSPSTTVCRAAASVCDGAEYCTGASNACPSDIVAPSTTLCRASAGACDAAEYCTGSTGTCPADLLSASGTVCRPATGSCDVVETCNGSSATCPADVVQPSSTVCRASAGVCDVAESCTGSSGACPAEAFLPSSTVCRGAAGSCDVAENCSGQAAACPADAFLPSSTVCRSMAGVCDVAESCTGSSANCPSDVLAAPTTTCRASGGVCDLAETCTGAAVDCPGDAKSTALCRASAGVCDTAETCDGVNDSCPANALVDANTVCRSAAGACDSVETCDGSSVTCPGDAKSTAECRAVADLCDTAEACDGVSDDCPADAFLPVETECRPSRSECDSAEFCTGTAACAPDIRAALGVPCSSDGNACTDDVCDGFGICGVNNAIGCDDGLFCNGTDTCQDGACGVHTGYPCGGLDCTTCDENADLCSNDAPGAPCPDDGNQCSDDQCDGSGGCVHPPIVLAPLCDWIVVGGSDTQRSTVRTRYNAQIYGGVCADKGDIGEATHLLVLPGTEESVWALVADTGTAAKVRADAYVENGRVLTGGGCLLSMQAAAIFDTAETAEICCDQSPVELPGGNPANVIDACGLDPKIEECRTAKASIPADIALLDSLPATQDLGNVALRPQEQRAIALEPGLNVIDIEKLRMNQSSVLTLDAQGDSSAVAILRLARGMSTKVKASVQLAGGLTAGNVLFYAETGNCIIGWNNSGAGTLFCPQGKVRLQIDTEWVGSVGGGSSVDIGWSTTLTHQPFLGLSMAALDQGE